MTSRSLGGYISMWVTCDFISNMLAEEEEEKKEEDFVTTDLVSAKRWSVVCVRLFFVGLFWHRIIHV